MSTSARTLASITQLPLFFSGIRIPPTEQTGLILKPFTYYYPPNAVTPWGVTALNPNKSISDIVQIESDSDFLWLAWYQAGLNTSGNTYTIDITDSESYQLFTGYNNSALSFSSFDPTMLPCPHLFPRSGRIGLKLTNLSPVATQAIALAFVGVKIFKA